MTHVALTVTSTITHLTLQDLTCIREASDHCDKDIKSLNVIDVAELEEKSRKTGVFHDFFCQFSDHLAEKLSHFEHLTGLFSCFSRFYMI